MKQRKFFSHPPASRVVVVLCLGALAMVAVYCWRATRGPVELPPEQIALGIDRVERVVSAVETSPFGKTERGAALNGRIRELVGKSAIRFSPEPDTDVTWRRNPGFTAMLYIRVRLNSDGAVTWPTDEDLCRWLYREVLHDIMGPMKPCREQICDALCAEEQGLASFTGCDIQGPFARDRLSLWRWVEREYPRSFSLPEYKPLHLSPAQLAEWAEIDHGKSGGEPKGKE